MPYIHEHRRLTYDDYELMPPKTGADLNYVVSRIMARYVGFHGKSYAVLASVQAAISGALHEFERCVVDPYEESKRQENGDVWEEAL